MTGKSRGILIIIFGIGFLFALFLTQNLPLTFGDDLNIIEIYRINQNLPPDAKILNAEEVRIFYFDLPMMRKSEFDRRVRGTAIGGAH